MHTFDLQLAARLPPSPPTIQFGEGVGGKGGLLAFVTFEQTKQKLYSHQIVRWKKQPPPPPVRVCGPRNAVKAEMKLSGLEDPIKKTRWAT